MPKRSTIFSMQMEIPLTMIFGTARRNPSEMKPSTSSLPHPDTFNFSSQTFGQHLEMFSWMLRTVSFWHDVFRCQKLSKANTAKNAVTLQFFPSSCRRNDRLNIQQLLLEKTFKRNKISTEVTMEEFKPT